MKMMPQKIQQRNANDKYRKFKVKARILYQVGMSKKNPAIAHSVILPNTLLH